MPSVHRMVNLITSLGFVYKTFQKTFAMHDRAPGTPQTLGGLFHYQLLLGDCRLLPPDLSASVPPSEMVCINLSHAWFPELFQCRVLLC